MTLLSCMMYIKVCSCRVYARKNRAVVLFLSRHCHKCILDALEDMKPEIIDFYKISKAEVDNLDQKCEVYSVGH